MAKTILEDISAFLAQQNAWTVSLPYDIGTLHKINDDNLLFIGEQLNKLKDDTKVELNKFSLSNDSIQTQLNEFVVNYSKQVDAIKRFISSHKGEYLIEVKKIYTRLDKEHNWMVKELTGAATDRVDIRQELGYEITKRRSQDNVLNTKIESEIYDRISKQDQLKADLEASIAATNVNISTLDAKISAETTSRTNSITTLSTAIGNEVAARTAADSTLNNAIITVGNNLSIETATRVAQDNTLSAAITSTKNTLSNTISEIETRRISDLGILSSRDNLEEDESKKRDYIVLQEVRGIYANPLYSEVYTTPASAPLLPFSNGVKDWDQISSSAGVPSTTSTATSAAGSMHGILANAIRKLNLLAKFVQGSAGDAYDTDPNVSTSNTTVGLDYWHGSEYRTEAGLFYHKLGTGPNKTVLDSDYAGNTLNIGSGYNGLNLLNSFMSIDQNAKTIQMNTCTSISANNVMNFSINTNSVGGGEMHASKFVGVATSAQYADIAERYLADDIYLPGTVLSLGGKNEVTLYNPELPLAGVVSTNPAFRMNDTMNLDIENNEYTEFNKMNPFIALKGRIPVSITGIANKGDYILACNNVLGKGVAFKRKDLPADYQLRLIGIAITDSNDSTDGTIEVKV